MKKFAMSLALAALATSAFADVPQLLNYQGNLTDPSGNPENGNFTMAFSVYDAESGGNQLPTGTPWSETQNVVVTDGVFNVLLGSVTALPTTLFEGGPSDPSGPLRFLQVSVSGETLAPRRRIASAAYALGTTSQGSATSFATGRISGNSTTTQNIDYPFITTFPPRIITVYYELVINKAPSTLHSAGTAVFDGVNLKDNFKLYANETNAATLTPNKVGHFTADLPQVLDAPGISVHLSVGSVGPLGFTITVSYATTSPSLAASFLAVATQ